MNKEFIPYQEALELKELGFDEYVFEYYDIDTKELCDVYKDIPAPLYQQAFRWFREKYNIFSSINVDQTMEPKFAYCISKYESTKFIAGWYTIIFNSDLYYEYEEAEFDCLNKLIEIVKQKQ